ncbi:MAG: acetyl-CoA carboxylase biotin carboxylase subunit, partial [Rhodobacteraceae bacterium]|nr:acetyl-CoA carboxylase biotin carboxylase subunit [Paracoccaceae bacterium]
MATFKKILIANRGEIACRVMRTAKRLGIRTVAVYSDADSRAMHVAMADEAVRIGGPAAADSYLLIDRVVGAALETGADAVHPGYGFLSEMSGFAHALKRHKIAFIGPPPDAIDAMGDKLASKRIARESGVNTIPGHMGIVESADQAVTIADEIGYPVMIKASAGGGGKGMRIAHAADEVREGFASSRNEAAGAFGDDRILIEKFITMPRHIEIQILADTHGNCIHLNERECSIQRRHQKVIEEAPSPFLDRKTRAEMGKQACALATAVNYCSAGTVEFVVDADRTFYFLEMNTRLQVEHPITELITGVDLVEEMIRIAQGEKLRIRQSAVEPKGWAIESRIYAEDPERGFLPSTGRLTRYRPPVSTESGTAIIRNDTGVYEGGEISVHYDPMIAKLCSWAPDRDRAIAVMRSALDQFEIEGIACNLSFLSAVMDHDRFISGSLTTAFIEEEYPAGFTGVDATSERTAQLAGIVLAMHRIASRRNLTTGPEDPAVLVVSADGKELLSARISGAGPLTVTIGDHEPYHIDLDWVPGEHLVPAHVNND